VAFPESLTSIGEGAFGWCDSLTGFISIPDSVTNMAANPFMACPITDFNVSPGNRAFAQIDGVLFDKQGKTVIAYPKARVGDYAIPQGVTYIRDMSFWFCDGLTGVTIPNSVTVIDGYAFNLCSGLTGVTIPGSVVSIGDELFHACTEPSPHSGRQLRRFPLLPHNFQHGSRG